MKCVNGFSSAGLGNDAVSFEIAASHAAWNSGERVEDVSLSPLAAAFVAIVSSLLVLLCANASAGSTCGVDDDNLLLAVDRTIAVLVNDLWAVKA
jgi:hypothetical protein